MSTKTYAEFQSELMFALGNRTDLNSYKANWVNTAYLSFCSMRKIAGRRLYLPELEDIDTSKIIGDGETYVLKPTSAYVVLGVYDTTNDNELTYKPSKWYFKQEDRADTDNEDAPAFWSPFKNKLYLYPTSDDDYDLEITYRKKPTLLSASTSTLLIGDEWDEIVLKLAVIQSLRRMRQYERAEGEEKIWFLTVRDMLGIWDEAEENRNEYARPDQNYFNWSY